MRRSNMCAECRGNTSSTSLVLLHLHSYALLQCSTVIQYCMCNAQVFSLGVERDAHAEVSDRGYASSDSSPSKCSNDRDEVVLHVVHHASSEATSIR